MCNSNTAISSSVCVPWLMRHSEFCRPKKEPPNFHMWLVPISDVHVFFPDWEDLCVPCPFGRIFYDRVASWFSKLHWPRSRASNGPGISLIEPYVDFVVESQSETPINHEKEDVRLSITCWIVIHFYKKQGPPSRNTLKHGLLSGNGPLLINSLVHH